MIIIPDLYSYAGRKEVIPVPVVSVTSATPTNLPCYPKGLVSDYRVGVAPRVRLGSDRSSSHGTSDAWKTFRFLRKMGWVHRTLSSDY